MRNAPGVVSGRAAHACAGARPQEKGKGADAAAPRPGRRLGSPGIRKETLQKKKKSPLAVVYFPTPSPAQYRRRYNVSLPCSGWERVGPLRSNHQGTIHK